jgi:energy-converting hydrogenase Eha subunit A
MTNEEIIGLYATGRLAKELFVNILNLKIILASIDNGAGISSEHITALVSRLFPEPEVKAEVKGKGNG